MTAGYEQFKCFLQSLAVLPEVEVEKADRLFQPVVLQKGAFFQRAGEIPQKLGFVISGVLSLYYIDRQGDEWIKAFCIENHTVAAYSALLQQQPSRLFIQALETSSLLVAPYTEYQKLATEHPCWQVVNRKMAEALFMKKEQREAELLLDDAVTRYQQFRADYPGLEKRIKQHYIASYLGITPVSLSRIRAQMKRS